MEAVAGYKHVGALAVAVLCLGLGLLVTRWPQTKRMTFSQHAAAYRHTIIYYCILFTLVLPLVLAFFICWFVPTFHLTYWFTVFIVISCVMQYACTFVPEVGGKKSQYHQALAGLSAIALIPPLFLLLNSSYVYGPAKLIILFNLMLMIIVLGLFGINKQRYLSWKLQAIYFAAFFFAIFALTY